MPLTPQISPDQVSVSHAFLLISHIFDATDGLPPAFIETGVDELFLQVCEMEGANFDGTMSLFTKIIYIQHFITQLEEANKQKELKQILTSIQTMLTLVEQGPIKHLLGVNQMFVSAILQKTM